MFWVSESAQGRACSHGDSEQSAEFEEGTVLGQLMLPILDELAGRRHLKGVDGSAKS